jgi:hypothetical protein
MLQFTQQQIASIMDICEDNGANCQRVARNQWGGQVQGFMGTKRATAGKLGKLVENAKVLRSPREVVVSRQSEFEECHTTEKPLSDGKRYMPSHTSVEAFYWILLQLDRTPAIHGVIAHDMFKHTMWCLFPVKYLPA